MTSETRLKLSGVVILLSALYGVVIAKDPSVASAISSGYIAIVLTILVLNHVWKKQ